MVKGSFHIRGFTDSNLEANLSGKKHLNQAPLASFKLID